MDLIYLIRKGKKTYLVRTCASSKDLHSHIRESDQNLHWAHFDDQWCKVSSCGQRRLWSDCADAQADLSLLCAHMSEGKFSHVIAHLVAFMPRKLERLCFCSKLSLQRQHLFPKMLPLKWICSYKEPLMVRKICKKDLVLFLFPHRTYVLNIC